MQTVMMLAIANIKKAKTHLISLVSLIFIAALFLNLGLLFFVNLGKFYEERTEAQNGAHGIVVLKQSAYERSDQEFFEDYPGVKEVQAEEMVMLINSEFRYGADMMPRSVGLYNFDEQRQISKFKFIGTHLQADENTIYLPYTMKSGGYGLGDEFVLRYADRDYTFTVAGFVEDIYFGSTMTGLIDMYMPDEAYQRFINTLNDSSIYAVTLSVRMSSAADAQQLMADYNDSISSREKEGSSSIYIYSDINEIKYYRTMIPNMISTILVAFSAIIVVVCLIVVRFRIINTIQDGMTNIGTLKAVGYTSRQIITSIVLQFGGITTVSSILGIAVSFMATPLLSGAFAGLIGLNWEQGFDLVITSVSFLLITGTVILVSAMSAGRINKLHPITALRGDSAAGAFRRNFFPLDRSAISLNLALALKSVFQKIKQNLMISLILMGVSFTVMFSIVMYYNFAVDNSAFLRMGIGEPANVSAYANEYNERLVERIARMPEVRKAFYSETEYQHASTTLNREKIYLTAMEDFSVSENEMILAGGYPQNPGEIAFPGLIAKRYGKQIGDSVPVKIGDAEVEFVICGLTQSLNNGGRMAAVTLEGVKRLLPEFEMREISIFLNPHEDTKNFMEVLKDEFGEVITDTVNIDEAIESSMGTYVSMTVLLTGVIMMTSILVVILVLYLIIKTNISQKKRDLGIQKAVGFTTVQLMNQISLGFMPVVLFGAVLGGVLSMAYINSILAVLFGTMGIMKMDFTINASWAVITALAVTGFSYGVSMFITWRIRKISPYVLAGE